MSRKTITAIAILLLTSNAAADARFSLRFPANPPRYLRELPLNHITQSDLLDQLGIPQSTLELAGQTRWQYDKVDGQGTMRLSITYVLVDGVVVDAIYTATGCGFRCPYSGISASEQQGITR